MTSVVTEDDKTTEDTQFNLGADFKGKANTTSTVIEIHYYYWRKLFFKSPPFSLRNPTINHYTHLLIQILSFCSHF